MMTTKLLTVVTVEDICDGFVYNELEGKGLYGWGGKLVIQPEYQRNYIYEPVAKPPFARGRDALVASKKDDSFHF